MGTITNWEKTPEVETAREIDLASGSGLQAAIGLTLGLKKQACEFCRVSSRAVIVVPDIFAACERLALEGITPLSGPRAKSQTFDAPGNHDVAAVFEDPDGNRVELIEHIRLAHRAGIYL